MAAYIIMAAAIPLALYLIRKWPVLASPFAVICVGSALALVLCVIRAGYPKVYGTMEILTAFVVFAYTSQLIEARTVNFTAGLGFVTAVYVIVRGIQNFADGLAAQRKRKIFRWFFTEDHGH
jgi:hypothetical protein